MKTFFDILACAGSLALVAWCVVSVYEGLKEMRADRLRETAKERAERRRETDACRAQLCAVEREKLQRIRARRAA